jgi:hypothetical protein
MKDAIGKEIQLGDQIAHACSAGSGSIVLRFGRVVKLISKQHLTVHNQKVEINYVYYLVSGYSRLCFARRADRCLVIPS